MAAIHSTIRRPFAAMARSYRHLATRQRSRSRRFSVSHAKSPSRYLQSWCARHTLPTRIVR